MVAILPRRACESGYARVLLEQVLLVTVQRGLTLPPLANITRRVLRNDPSIKVIMLWFTGLLHLAASS